MSTSPEAVTGARALRVAGVVFLLVLQGGCVGIHLLAANLVREQTAANPSRETEHARLAALDAPPPLFPSAQGYVEQLDGDTVLMMTPLQRRRIRIDAYTTFFTPAGRGRVDAIRPGAGLTVGGAILPDESILADVAIVRPPP